jgi:hypothetical protein
VPSRASNERGETPAGFRTQLLQRLRNEAIRVGVPVQRLQQRVAFERLLSRLTLDGEWVLKGGFALAFRYGLDSRSTKDVDLRTLLAPETALDRLRQTVARAAPVDHFAFDLGDVVQEMRGAPGGSLRVRVTTLVGGQAFTTFHLDLSSGDALTDEPDLLSGSDLLQFAGIPPISFPVYPITQHLAEKLHAYTLPRSQENTRVKDLVDLIVIAATERIEADRLGRSVGATFAVRGTHAVPDRLPEPPASWTQPFARLVGDRALAASRSWGGLRARGSIPRPVPVERRHAPDLVARSGALDGRADWMMWSRVLSRHLVQ